MLDQCSPAVSEARRYHYQYFSVGEVTLILRHIAISRRTINKFIPELLSRATMASSPSGPQSLLAQRVAIGIDLGTSFSVVAVFKEGEKSAQVVLDHQGNAVTPSVVAFTHTAQLIEVKRLMGRKFNDPQVTEDAQRWPFTLVDINGEPRLQVQFRGESRQYRPEQISAMILMYLKRLACEHIGLPPFGQIDVVLTVPVNFGDTERQAVNEACHIAGLKCVRFVTEPAAAALAYAWDELQQRGEKDKGGRVLVFDMGGGTTDVSIMRLGSDHQYEVLACKGNNHLGGEDLDTRLVEFCLERSAFSDDIKIRASRSAMVRIRQRCEQAKCELSTIPKALIEVDEIIQGTPFTFRISRVEFEKLVEDIFHEAVTLVRSCMDEVGLDAADIARVVLAGGSSRIPKVQQMLMEALPGVPLHTSLSQDEAVACGAALQAAKDKGILDLCLSERIPRSLGIALFDGTINRVIEKNTPIPTTNTVVYHTLNDNQTELIFDVYEGEGTNSRDNKLVGSMTLTKMRKAAACEVTAKEQECNNKISVRIERYRQLLSAQEVTGLAQQAETEHLHGVVHELNDQMAALCQRVDAEQRLGVELQANRVRDWEANNPNPTAAAFGELVTELQEGLEQYGVVVSKGGAIVHHKTK
ncbi:hypothetical protein B566_EDAN008828 [Ephemera danica]|nr:hypothetical protein B566_EDAN008828 [Ephemera danica]